jgi:hypothetical protein
MVDHVVHHPAAQNGHTRHIYSWNCCSEMIVARAWDCFAARGKILSNASNSSAFEAVSGIFLACPLTTAAAKLGMAAKWLASLPRLEDFSWGVHANLSAGTHSKILRVFAIS